MSDNIRKRTFDDKKNRLITGYVNMDEFDKYWESRNFRKIGEIICLSKDWRSISFWSYNIHKIVRNKCKKRTIWDELDELIDHESDWHLAKSLFDKILDVNITEDSNEKKIELNYYALIWEKL